MWDSQLHDEGDPITLYEDIVELNESGMSQSAHNPHLVHHALLLIQAAVGNNFGRQLVACGLLLAPIYVSKLATAKRARSCLCGYHVYHQHHSYLNPQVTKPWRMSFTDSWQTTDCAKFCNANRLVYVMLQMSHWAISGLNIVSIPSKIWPHTCNTLALVLSSVAVVNLTHLGSRT